MKAATALFLLLVAVGRASDPAEGRRFETEYDRVRAVRGAMRQMKPGMDYDAVLQLLPERAVSRVYEPTTSFLRLDLIYKVDWGVRLELNFDSQTRSLNKATLTRGEEVIQQAGK